MGQAAEPLPHDSVDFRGIQGVGDALDPRRLFRGPDAVVERLVGDGALRELAFEPFVAVETDLHRVGKVGAELDEQRAEVPVEDVDIVVIDRGRRADDPRVGRSVGIPPLLGAEDTGLLLGLADEEHPFVSRERGQVGVRHVILPLVLLKGDQIDACGLGEALYRVDEPLGHRRHHRGRRDARPQVSLQEVHDAAARLQRRHVAVQVHSVDRFQFEGHVMVKDFSDTFAYHGAGAPGERGPRGHRPNRVYHLGAGCNPCLASGSSVFFLTRLRLRPSTCTGSFPPHARRSEAEPR